MFNVEEGENFLLVHRTKGGDEPAGIKSKDERGGKGWWGGAKGTAGPEGGQMPLEWRGKRKTVAGER